MSSSRTNRITESLSTRHLQRRIFQVRAARVVCEVSFEHRALEESLIVFSF